MSNVVQMNVHDKERMNQLLQQEPSFNNFVISDLEYGEYRQDFVRIYGETDGRELLSLLMIFQDKIVYYSPDDRPVDCYVQHVREAKVTKLVGKKALVEKFIPHLKFKGHSNCHLRELGMPPNHLTDSPIVVKRMESREEAAKLHDLFLQVEEYGFTGTDRDKYMDEQIKFIDNDSIRTYFAEVNGEMVSTAAYINDRPRTTIVVGVATPPQHRKQGYASHVLYRLCWDAIHAGRVLYLFYTNPQAGAVYQRLGFRDGGEWTVLTLR